MRGISWWFPSAFIRMISVSTILWTLWRREGRHRISAFRTGLRNNGNSVCRRNTAFPPLAKRGTRGGDPGADGFPAGSVLFRALNYASFCFSGAGLLPGSGKRTPRWFFLSNLAGASVHSGRRISQADKRAAGFILLRPLAGISEGVERGGASSLFRLMHRVSRRVYQQADTLAVTSAPFRDYLREVDGVEDERIVELPQHAEDLYADICGEYDENGCVDFLFAGNIGAVQNVDCILRAAALVKQGRREKAEPPFHIHIVGAVRSWRIAEIWRTSCLWEKR